MSRSSILLVAVGAVMGCLLLSCTPQAFFNNTASLGGSTPGARGTVQVIFENRTPYRAVFTYGLFDEQDRAFLFDANQQANRQFGQFVIDPDPTNPLQASLVGNTTSNLITLVCGRTLALGTQRLIEVLQMSRLNITLDDKALETGIAFWPADDPSATTPVGRIQGGATVLQGYEFQCESEVVFRLEQNADGSFAVNWTVILP